MSPRISVVRMAASVSAAVAAICLAVSIVILVPTVDGQQDRLAHQSLELECRGDLAAQSDVLRNEMTMWVSRGLRGLVRDDQELIDRSIRELDLLDEQIIAHNKEREATTRLCAED